MALFNMYERQLPAAVLRERRAMLGDAVKKLQKDGYESFEVDDLEGYPDPEDVNAPRTNVPIRPDILGRGKSGTVCALTEVSSTLTDDLWGRRWQSLQQWAQGHEARFVVFVHPEDQDTARQLAQQWKVDPESVVALERGQ